MTKDAIRGLQEHASAGRYEPLIKELRQLVADDRRVLTDPAVKAWCGQRWRDFFVRAAVKDERALKAASRVIGDRRPAAQRIAEQYLMGADRHEWKQELPPSASLHLAKTTLLFAPGLLTGLLPVRAFERGFTRLAEGRRWPILRADAHPMRGCDANIADYMKALDTGEGLSAQAGPISPEDAVAPKDVIIIGYSKGAPDVLALMAKHPELKDRVRAVFTWAGAVGGSFVADDMYEVIKDMTFGTIGEGAILAIKLLAPMIDIKEGSLGRLPEYDPKQAVLDLCTHERDKFWKENADLLDGLDVPFFNLAGVTSAREVPAFQLQGYLRIAKDAAQNDMQVSHDQAQMEIPMATSLATLRGHHWDLSYGPFPRPMRTLSPALRHFFPREAAVTAMVELSLELGLAD